MLTSGRKNHSVVSRNSKRIEKQEMMSGGGPKTAAVSNNNVVLDGGNDDEDGDNKKKWRRIWRSDNLYLGYFIIFLSSIISTFVGVFIKLLKGVDPFILVFFRNVVIFGIASSRVLFSRLQVLRSAKDSFKLIARGLCGAVSVMGMFTAYRYLPIGDARIIQSSVPVFATIFGRIFLHEECGIFQYANIGITLSGIAIVMQPPILFGENPLPAAASSYLSGNASTSNSTSFHPVLVQIQNATNATSFESLVMKNSSKPDRSKLYGVLGASVSVLAKSLSTVLTRSLKDIPVNVVTFYSGLIGMIPPLIVSLADGHLQNLILTNYYIDPIYIFLIGLCAYAAQTLMTLSYHFDEAGTISLFKKAFDVIVAYFIQVVFFDTKPTRITVLGSLVVMSAVLNAGSRKLVLKNKRKKKEKVHPFLKAFWCLPFEEEDFEFWHLKKPKSKEEEIITHL